VTGKDTVTAPAFVTPAVF